MKLPQTIISKSEKETIKIAKRFAKSLKPGAIVLLSGDLGAGKTVFSKGFCLGRGVKNDVVSPTFTIVNDYSGKVNHYDLYRLSGVKEFEDTGAQELLYSLNAVSIVEWPEKVGFTYFPTFSKKVIIEKIDETKRKITITENI